MVHMVNVRSDPTGKKDREQPLLEMQVAIHPRVLKVLEFMNQRIPAAELAGVANAVALLAPSLWGDYRADPVRGLAISGALPPLEDCASPATPPQ